MPSRTLANELSARRAAIALVAITLVTLALRLFRIDAQSAWIDEAFTIHAAAGRWDDMLDMLIRDFNHPPLHTVLVKWWFAVFDVGVLQARVLSAIFGTLAVPAVYRLGTLLFDRGTALVASLLLAISQLGIIYSQEARAYSLLLLLAIVSTGFFIRAVRSGGIRDFGALIVVTSLMLYTHYYSVFAIASLLIYAFVFRRSSAIPRSWWVGAIGVITVAYLPWLTSGVVESMIANPTGAVDHRVFAQLASPVYALNWFNNGKLMGVREQTPWWAFPVGCLLFTAPALSALRRLREWTDRERSSVCLLALSAGLPVLAVAALGFAHVVYDVRHVSFAVAPYYLLVARGITSITSAMVRRLLLVAIIGYSTLSFRTDYFIPYKENYRDALSLLVTQSRPADCTVFGAPDGRSYGRLYWTAYYDGQMPPRFIEPDQAEVSSECQRIWLVWDKMFWKVGPLTYEAVRERLGQAYRLESHRSFLGVDVDVFLRMGN